MKFLGPTRYNNASFPSIDFSFLGERSRVSTSNYLVYTSEFVYNGVNNEERRERCEGLRGIPSWKGQSLGTRVLNNFLVCRVSTIVAVVYCLASHSESVTPFPLTRRLRPPPPSDLFVSRVIQLYPMRHLAINYLCSSIPSAPTREGCRSFERCLPTCNPTRLGKGTALSAPMRLRTIVALNFYRRLCSRNIPGRDGRDIY